MKPTIYKSKLLGKWVCRDLDEEPSRRGIGDTPDKAYEHWQALSQAHSKPLIEKLSARGYAY